MKRFFLLLSILIIGFSVFCQPPTVKNGKAVFKNSTDSFSYALGLTLASYYKTQGIKTYNTDLFIKALNDVINNKKELTDDEANNILGIIINKARIDRLAFNRSENEKFFAENGKKPGVVTTASGLQYLILKEGAGPKPGALDTVKVNYKGSILDGTVFDDSKDHGGAVRFPVGGMIKGWTEVLQLMPKGSKWKVFVPSDLAYGEAGAGDKIAPNALLIYEIEIVDVMPFIPPKVD